MIIAGDIGGTKTNIALFDTDGQRVGRVVTQRSYPSSDFDSLETIIEQFIAEVRPSTVTHACFGVAGPVVGGRVEATNLSWVVSERELAATLKLESVGVINDLEATAHGIDELQPSQLYTLNEGAGPRPGHRALIAAGTGLGMSSMFWDGRRYHPIPGEGGHIDFAPRNEREMELLRHLTREFGGHVSYERVLSGMGLSNIYAFMKSRGGAEEPEWLAEEISRGDEAAAISRAALDNKSDLAVETLDLFVKVYGAMAGNLALLIKPFGGLFIGGGIAPKILDKLRDGKFLNAYKDKGRMSWLVESIPVYVILDDKTALYGAARYALNGGA